jgi:hypothetical protein
MVRTKQLTGVALAHYVGQMFLLLRKLREEDRTMSYEEVGRAIGLTAEDERWTQRQQYQISRILNATVAVDRYTTVQEITRDDIARIINAGSYSQTERINRSRGQAHEGVSFDAGGMIQPGSSHGRSAVTKQWK